MRKGIADSETILVYMNYFWLIAIGAFSAVESVFDVIFNTVPDIIMISFDLSGVHLD